MTNQNMPQSETSSLGRLQIGVYATDVGKPIGNATVQISHSNNKSIIVDELVSNTSGQTPTIDLAAPPLEYSQNPGEPKPYSEYDLRIMMDGFYPATVEGVQILPDSLAIQNIRLKPIVTQTAQVNNIFIKQHTLWGYFPPKVPEDDVKPLPESLGFVVLPEPVIPEFIVVHDGVPSDTSAQNYYVPFKDYIKNVASCEIYSTWPRAAIEANVLAILSFTLNRVYTEWYRGKGYNFTVTNSTAFDQAFVYERNIYDEISVVVDDLFTSFITRPGIRQPLLTQYCDGSRTQCPKWLSQWGSQQLAGQGRNSMDILRNYYGQDIFLMQAKKVEGVPVSYPGTPLEVGTTGESVRTIQQQLNTISNNYPAIEKMRVDGIYGPQTKKAVETFQQIFDLPQSGIVDFATWYQISNIYVAVTKLAEL